MNEKDRSALKSYFTPGARPTSNQFGFLIDACANLAEDNDNNLKLAGSIKVQDHIEANVPPSPPSPPSPGCIQYNTTTNQFEGFLSGGGGWTSLGGGGALGNPITVGNEASLGTYVGNVPGLNNAAVFSHSDHFSTSNGRDFALAQGQGGQVIINSGVGNSIFFANNGRQRIEASSSALTLLGSPARPVNLVITEGNLDVHGTCRNDDGFWIAFSDKRVKKKIKPFNEGLAALVKINPVEFEYNGKAKTRKNFKSIGVVAQDVEKPCPYTIVHTKEKLNEDDKEETDLLMFNGGPLLYVTINAIKELNNQILELKEQINNLS